MKKEVMKIRPDPLNPEKWRQKHKEEKKSSTQKFPTVGSYDPLPMDMTFARILKENEKKKGNGKAKTHFFGNSDRFKDPKKIKSKSYVNIPGPGNYNVLIEWEGKVESTKAGTTKKKGVNLSKLISKGVDKSIYYEDSFERNNSAPSVN